MHKSNPDDRRSKRCVPPSSKVCCPQLENLERGFRAILKEMCEMNAAMTRLEASVAAIKGASDSAEALLSGLSAEIKRLAAELAAQGANVTKLNELAATLESEKEQLGAAVAANPLPGVGTPGTQPFGTDAQGNDVDALGRRIDGNGNLI